MTPSATKRPNVRTARGPIANERHVQYGIPVTTTAAAGTWSDYGRSARTGAALLVGNTRERLFDVLTAALPGRLAADGAGCRTAHGKHPS